MDVIGFISIGLLVVVQITAFAYYYGKLTQKVSDIDKRLNDMSHCIERIEKSRKE